MNDSLYLYMNPSNESHSFSTHPPTHSNNNERAGEHQGTTTTKAACPIARPAQSRFLSAAGASSNSGRSISTPFSGVIFW